MAMKMLSASYQQNDLVKVGIERLSVSGFRCQHPVTGVRLGSNYECMLDLRYLYSLF